MGDRVMMPETLEGWAVLHEMFRFDWIRWKQLPAGERKEAIAQAQDQLGATIEPSKGASACFSLLGHKGDLLFVHFRETFDELNGIELKSRQLRWFDFLEPTTSYVSFVELGLYEMTVKLEQELRGAGLTPDQDEWSRRWKNSMDEQRERVKSRLYPAIPDDRYLCFYPMDKKRGEIKNWYDLPIEKRQEMMRDHGLIGRKYGGRVTQIISGSIGYDNWEWGVDLFAKEPLVFKKLIYEMRFDEASAAYALFGPFYIGMRMDFANLGQWCSGTLPVHVLK